MFFKKKQKFTDTDVVAVCDGEVIAMSAVNDQVFSSKAMGDGFAVRPSSGTVYAPMNGTIASIFPTKHAITMTSTSGHEIMIHMGIDTVNLGGEGFKVHVQEGQTITAGSPIAEMDLKSITPQVPSTDVIVVFFNLKENESVITTSAHAVGGKDVIFTF
ncbi:PTS glucose transporter subunit IIA [Erysipelothrix sp. HDW6C]|uniref:PTS sugar transporter subunit IIA n=1 Tax=Erysipelothrix sp. HDW6C TaxID=2714930 RepID=UPI00140A2A26|nr:PTS glucose transporter subunit IIA [Erysipelothrix sp. HDW6C]QIK68946.1 PTS glucose transporter subunit IIA [Erysipelothrix sp. HDW6C]